MLITVVPMVPALLILLGFGIWSSRSEAGERREIAVVPFQNLTRVVPIAPSRPDCEHVLSELCRLARREAVLRNESMRAASGHREQLTDEECFVLRVLADRVDVLRAHQMARGQSGQLLLDVEALDFIRQRDENTRALRSVPRPRTAA
ncbi:MAG: hypothetical protein GY713_19850 [Actinomycetia bacterium]|nr:hypothetical protein [Actinomycetes bacterium]